jgi:hypothetical protein
MYFYFSAKKQASKELLALCKQKNIHIPISAYSLAFRRLYFECCYTLICSDTFYIS